MARNSEHKIPGLTPTTDGYSRMQIETVFEDKEYAFTRAFVGEGHELVIGGVGRMLARPTSEDGSLSPTENFGMITPVMYTHEFPDDDTACASGFTAKNLNADLKSELVVIAEPIKLTLPHKREGAVVWQREILRSGQEDAGLIIENFAKTLMIHSHELAGNGNDTLRDGHGRTADVVILGKEETPFVSLLVDTDDLSTATVQDSAVKSESEVEACKAKFGSYRETYDGRTDHGEITWTIKGPAYGMATRAVGVIVEFSGSVRSVVSNASVSDRVTTSTLYAANVPNVLSGQIINIAERA